MSVAVSSPDGAFVYVTGFADDDVAVFSRNPSTGKLTFVEKETNLGGAQGRPAGLGAEPGGRGPSLRGIQGRRGDGSSTEIREQAC